MDKLLSAHRQAISLSIVLIALCQESPDNQQLEEIRDNALELMDDMSTIIEQVLET